MNIRVNQQKIKKNNKNELKFLIKQILIGIK